MNVKIIGAGIFGCNIAVSLAKRGLKVDLHERENEILQGASANNHNRLHTGAHYPRSFQTIEEILSSVEIFEKRYHEAVVSDIETTYAIAKNGSHLTSVEFEEALEGRVPGFHRVEKSDFPYYNENKIDNIYSVKENVYDIAILKSTMKDRLDQAGVALHLGKEIDVNKLASDEKFYVIDCTYGSRLYGNAMQAFYKIENVHIPVVELDLDKKIACTVMDGPFISFLPSGRSSSEYLIYDVENSPGKDNFDTKYREIAKKFVEYYNVDILELKSVRQSRRVNPITKNDDRNLVVQTERNIATVLSGKVTSVITAENQILKWLNVVV
ncbi:FAD-binding oxidoreductase [bacterium]|nr:FAD-binding oxidoreductase [bacterium]